MTSLIKQNLMATLTKSIISIFLAMTLVSCSKSGNDQSPKAVLASYVQATMEIKSITDKTKLSNLTTGEAKKSLDAMDSGTFQNLFIDSHREFGALKIKDERELTPGKYSITYELSYKSKSPNSDDLVTIKKHAILVREGTSNRWLISEVQNLKTNIEHQNAMSF